MLNLSARRYRKLLFATIGGSLVWHVLSILLFSTVFFVEMGNDQTTPMLPPVKLYHIGNQASFGLMRSVVETLKALEITLPEKDKTERIAGVSDDSLTELEFDDIVTPEMDDKMTPSGASIRGNRGIGEGKSTHTTESKVHRLAVGELTLSGPGAGRKIIYQPPQPSYPRQCEENGIEGDVSIQFVVNKAGNISSVKVTKLSGSVHLDQTAKEYILKFQFDRSSEETKGVINVRFRLRKRERQ